MKDSYYFNGNYFVSLDSCGSKTYRALRYDDPILRAEFPDSIDLKITNKCSFGCPYCHENSSISGKSFNLEKTIKVLEELPKVGIEVAVGGGDILEIWDESKTLLNWLEDNNFNSRVTINYKDLDKFNEEILKELWYTAGAVGVSIDSKVSVDAIKRFEDKIYTINKVYHVIVGINPVEQIEDILNSVFNPSILILGYKKWGRGKDFIMTEDVIENWKRKFKSFLLERRKNKRSCKGELSFDNLALDQLDVRGCMLESDWKNRYMGDDFTHSMYIDAVNEIYSPTSRDPFRVSWNDMSLLEFFKKYRKEDKLK